MIAKVPGCIGQTRDSAPIVLLFERERERKLLAPRTGY